MLRADLCKSAIAAVKRQETGAFELPDARIGTDAGCAAASAITFTTFSRPNKKAWFLFSTGTRP